MPKNEELVGAQHKLDHNKDGKISGVDFKGLRKKSKKDKQETGTVNPKMDTVKSKGNEMEQKESTIRSRLMSIWEKAGEKKKHSPNQDKAEKPEDALTGQGAKDMMNQPKDLQDPLVKAVADQKKAAGQGPNAKARPNDSKVGDKKSIPSATPVKESSRLDGIINAYKSMYTPSIDDQQKLLNEDMHHIMKHVKNHNYDVKHIYRHEKHGEMVRNLRSHHIKVAMRHRERADKLATDPHHGPGHPLHMAHHEAADAHEKANEAHAHIEDQTRRGQQSTSHDDKNFHAAMSASHDATSKSSETYHVQRETSK